MGRKQTEIEDGQENKRLARREAHGNLPAMCANQKRVHTEGSSKAAWHFREYP
jgi:hypothetical protein